MNRRQRVAVAVLATMAATLAAGIFLRIHQEAAWWQQLRDAQTALTANQSSFGAARLNGQDLGQLVQQCQTAVGAYDQAAAHLQLTPLDPSTECTP